MSRLRADHAPARALRVVLADGSGVFRQGLQRLLEAAGVEVVSTVGDVPALVAAVRRLQPDLAIVDVRMFPAHVGAAVGASIDAGVGAGAETGVEAGVEAGIEAGVEAVLALKRERPEMGVIALSSSIEPGSVTAIVEDRQGGVGYLLKDTVEDMLGLLGALRRVAAGGIAVAPEAVSLLLGAGRPSERLTDLSPRDREVLALIAQGYPDRAIADALALSPKTVHGHVGELLDQLGVEHDGTDSGRTRAALTFLRSA
ncbi:MAG TPA: response regulator transcription factor [Pedococcus sp.]|nr:response regulator transcription factor [Pedococcus sp.]